MIVESPAKARTISRFLGSDYLVESSVGHVRDLPKGAADVPAAYKAAPWARLGVNVDDGFKPLYVISREKKDVVARLRKAVSQASELLLATDEDREGESIAWHLLEVLRPPRGVPVRRMVFHEITASAIRRALDDTRELDRRLVDAQEARRILDRLYGYEVSPVLWRKILPRLSAGRVQSVATRVVVERERARMRFGSANYAGLEATLTKGTNAQGSSGNGGDSQGRDGDGPDSKGHEDFPATLVAIDSRRVATGRDFDPSGNLVAPLGKAPLVHLDLDAARQLADRLRSSIPRVIAVEEKPYRRTPYAPFMTSTLQQEAGRKLRFPSARTMSVAQRLYENGFITYMRTDSTSLSATATAAARAQAAALYGPEYVPKNPRTYATKVRNAQEAHEAIRPAGETFRTPDQVRSELGADERALYELIWKRTVASQMVDVSGSSVAVKIEATSTTGEMAVFAASGRVIHFPGFLRAYVEGSDDPTAELEDAEVRLPALAVGDPLGLTSLEAKDHATSPPARFTEASLVKALEDMGVGRPSTYASIIATILDRGYVWKRGSALIPTFTAFAVVGLLEQHFSDLVDYAFTARMEDDLDGIAGGDKESAPWLGRFYFGNGTPGLRAMVSERLEDIDARSVNSITLGLDSDGIEVVVRVGRYGPYVSRGADTAAIPPDLAPDELTVPKAEELLAAPSGDRLLGTDPATGLEVVVRVGRFGPYVQRGGTGTDEAPTSTNGAQNDSDPTPAQPSDGSADGASEPVLVGGPREPSDSASATTRLARPAARTEPTAGAEPADRTEPVTKSARSTKDRTPKEKPATASLLKSMSVETVTLEDALALLSLPRLLGVDPVDGVEISALLGRYGPYVKKGTDSRSLASEDDLFTVTLAAALELLAQPRTRGRAAAAPPLRDLGPDPVTEAPILLKEGRFGPYVTDGTTNASLRSGDDPASVTPERAAELLAIRRERGPAPKRTASRSSGGRTATKAAGAKAPAKAVRKPTGAKSAGTKSAGTKSTGTRTVRKSGGTNADGAPTAGTRIVRKAGGPGAGRPRPT
ncbi:MAG: type I DNA topoisomerase [Acidimicrobiales bacterium]